MTNLGPSWYVLKTKRFKESHVQAQLQCSGIETYLPMVKVPKGYLRKGQRQIESLFPGYMFARLDPGSGHLFHLRGVHDFSSLVRFDGQPARLDPQVIHELRQREQGRGYITIESEWSQLRPYDPIRIVDGPFSGHTGLFVRYLDSAERICILLDLLQSEAMVELPLCSVAAVSGLPPAQVAHAL
jgi:transcriptional antiterminator RfaH